MKTMKKSLCFILSLVIALSSLSVAALATDTDSNETVSSEWDYSLRYYSSKPDSYGAGKLLDELDVALAEGDVYEEIAITDNIKFVIDLRSVNALCGTLDDFADLLDNLLIQAAIAVALGDLKNLDFDTWKTGMQRSSSNDTVILKEIVEFVNANSSIISGIVDGTLDLGVLNDTVDLASLLGEDGVSGIIKEAMFSVVYEGDSLDAAYAQYENDVDSFVYGPLLDKIAGDYLRGFTVTADTTVEDLIRTLFNSAMLEYAIPALKSIDVDLSESDIEDLRKLAPYINLDGSTYQIDGLVLSEDESVISQLNNLVGKLFVQIVPGYEWQEGDLSAINENLEGAFKYLGTVTGLVPDAEDMDFEEIVMQVIAIVLRNVEVGSYDDGVTECDSLEDMVKVALINAAREEDITYTYTEEDSWLVVLGDMLAVWAYDNFDIRDLQGNPYRGGKGDELWTSLNYFINYFLFEKDMADLLGLDADADDSIFTKIDKLLDYFGSTKSKGVSFDSEKFLLGDSSTKGLIDTVFTLDIGNLFEITLKPALENAGDVKAAEFIYNTVRYMLNNWSGENLLPAYVQQSAFTNALSNESIANLITGLLKTLNSRKGSLVKTIAFTCALAIDDDTNTGGSFSAVAENGYYTGSAVYPEATTVKIGDEVLEEGKDYEVIAISENFGAALAYIRLIGVYEGDVTVPFNIELAPVENITVTTTDTKVRLRWNPVAGADGYNVYIGDELAGTVSAQQEDLTMQFAELTPGTKYDFSVEAYKEGVDIAEKTEVSAVTNLPKVSGAKVTEVTGSTATITWDALEGADGYVIERYSSSKKAYVSAGKTTDTTFTVTGLYSYTGYYFRVKAYKTVEGTTVYSSSFDKLYKRTKVGQVTGLEASVRTSSAITLSWDSVRNAKGYRVEQYIGGKWTKLTSVTTTSYKVTGLTASTRYAFRVRAYYNSSNTGEYSKNLWVYTKLPKVTGVKTSSATSSSIKVSWSKVAGATSYVLYRSTNGKSWTKVGTTAGTYMTASKLYSGMNYQFKVVAYSNKIKSYGDYSSIVKATTLVGQVDNLVSTARTKSSVSLSWDKERGAAGYVVYRSTDGKTWTKVGTTTKNYITASGLNKNTTYQFKVRAYQKLDSTVYGTYSTVLKVKTRLL